MPQSRHDLELARLGSSVLMSGDEPRPSGDAGVRTLSDSSENIAESADLRKKVLEKLPNDAEARFI
jgi:hypothetical protein